MPSSELVGDETRGAATPTADPLGNSSMVTNGGFKRFWRNRAPAPRGAAWTRVCALSCSTIAVRGRYHKKIAQSRQAAKTGQTRVARIERPSLFDVFFETREESKSETENGNFNSLENGPEKVTVIRLTVVATGLARIAGQADAGSLPLGTPTDLLAKAKSDFRIIYNTDAMVWSEP